MKFIRLITLCSAFVVGGAAFSSYERIPEHVFEKPSTRSTYNLAFEVAGPKGHLHLSILEDYLDFYDRETLSTYNSNAVKHLQSMFAKNPNLVVELVRYDMFGAKHDLPVAVVRFIDPTIHQFFADLYEHRVKFAPHTGYVQQEHNSTYSPHITIGKRGQKKEEWNDPFTDGSVKTLDLCNATIFAAIANFIPVGDKSLRRNERINLFSGKNTLNSCWFDFR